MGMRVSFRKRHFIYLSIGIFATTGVLSIPHQFSGGTSAPPQAVALNSQGNVDCWIDLGAIVCFTKPNFCFAGLNQGSPSPQQCDITFP